MDTQVLSYFDDKCPYAYFPRALDEIEVLDGQGRERFEKTMTETGGTKIVDARLRHGIRFENDQYSIE